MSKEAFTKGDKLLIELDGRSVQAEFIRKSSEGIVVKNSKEAGSGKINKFNQTFFFNEIKRIQIIQRAPIVTDDAVPSTSQPHVVENNNNTTKEEEEEAAAAATVVAESVTETAPIEHIVNGEAKKKHFTEQEIKIIQERVNQTVHIIQHDDKYHNAIKDLKQQEIVSVNSENKFGRLEIIRPVITFATLNNVYIFDMVRLGAMKREMKEIFASDYPRKVVHSSAELTDYLQHKENCQLNNVFDTLLVHYNIEKTHQHISLQKCYTTYFELPDDFVLKDANYQSRPLPQPALVRTALNAILIMKMYWHMNDILMKPVYIASKKFSEIYPSVEHQVDLMVLMNNKKHPGADEIELNAMDYLDEELQFLDVNKA